MKLGIGAALCFGIGLIAASQYMAASNYATRVKAELDRDFYKSILDDCIRGAAVGLADFRGSFDVKCIKRETR